MYVSFKISKRIGNLPIILMLFPCYLSAGGFVTGEVCMYINSNHTANFDNFCYEFPMVILTCVDIIVYWNDG